MYLHLGADCVIKSSEIVGIFNLLDKKANIYEEFVRPNLKKYNVIDLSGDILPSSCIITKDRLYLSGISPGTLKRRKEEDFGLNAIYKR
ncbi:MAG: extracellular matrix regulator RemB [Acidaminococcaceae bacterium]